MSEAISVKAYDPAGIRTLMGEVVAHGGRCD
jgi:hypothetical protein